MILGFLTCPVNPFEVAEMADSPTHPDRSRPVRTALARAVSATGGRVPTPGQATARTNPIAWTSPVSRTTATGRHLAVAAPIAPEPAPSAAATSGRAALDQPAAHRQDLADEEAREVYMELLSIARATTDRALRDRLDVLCDRLAPPPEPARIDVPRLTSRELQVLGEIALGRTNNEIAQHLSIMPTTVKTYLKNTMRKFGTRNRVETILAARRAGLLRR